MRIQPTINTISVVVIAFSLFGCQKQQADSSTAMSEAKGFTSYQGVYADQAVADAVAIKDYRLLSTSTRMPQFPGTDQARYHEYKALCGANFLPNMGDVKQQGDNSMNRQQVKQYMAQYNEMMLAACLSKKDN